MVGYCSSFLLLKKKVCKKENSGTGKSRDEKSTQGLNPPNPELQAHIGRKFQLFLLGTAETDSFSLVFSMVKENENCYEHRKRKIQLIMQRLPEWMKPLIIS